MNRERRKVIGNIFGDAAKYTLTVGVISSVLAGKFAFVSSLVIGVFFVIFIVLAYYVTPKDI
jgi:uncharacterized membrane protein YkvA (DUF1232 family)